VTPDPATPSSEPPRWLTDEMLGRLTRYLRFLGHDTLQAKGLSDAEIRARAWTEGRVVVTRDRELARRSDPAILIRSVDIVGQLREVRTAYPSMPFTVTFDRCPECNARLVPWTPPAVGAPWPPVIPSDARETGLVVWECPACQRPYWEGSHASRIRSLLAEAWGPQAPP
jgi:uncharacterized protein with PIN domain